MNLDIKKSQDKDIYTVSISRRNLLELLAKLDGHPKNSRCTIVKGVFPGAVLVISAEEDAAHYGTTIPGKMHPATEEALRRRAENLAATTAMFRGGSGRD